MGRAAAVLSLTLACGMLLAPGAGSLAVAGETGAECTWQRHSKRVVKRVGHRGKLRRVVRTRHWWSCVPLPAAQPGPVPTPSNPAPAVESEPEQSANRVSVTSRDKTGYSYTLSRPQADAGAITIELNNHEGEDAHNLNLQLEGSGEPVHELGEAAPGKQRVATFNLPAGTYRLWCSIPTHDEQGMHATLVLEDE